MNEVQRPKITLSINEYGIEASTERKGSVWCTMANPISPEAKKALEQGCLDRKGQTMNYEELQEIQEVVDEINRFYLLNDLGVSVHWSFCEGYDHAHQNTHWYFLVWGVSKLAFFAEGPTRSVFLFKGMTDMLKKIAESEEELRIWATYIQDNKDYDLEWETKEAA